MENEKKVFSSSIIRTQNNIKNNLYDILTTIPASPVPHNKSAKNFQCSFVPKSDKHYTPKRKNGMKVKTVRDIRNVFQSDVYSYLPADLEKQKNFLLRKIRLGSSRDEKTKEIAKNMIKSCDPISKSAWQMLMNINPEEHKFPRQYVLWNGKFIQVNGSKGGSCKFMFKYDIGKIKETSLNKSIAKRTNMLTKKKLLQNSLHVKFKPGPLTKKKNLDTSYQKYQFGEMELVPLPKPGIEIQPSFGKPLAPVINKFLQNAVLLNSDGVISQKWADFAVSILGKNKNGTLIQLKENCNVTFDLDYKCFQRRILMRNDSDIRNPETVNRNIIQTNQEEESVILSEVTSVLDKIIDSVEISLKQNEMYSGEDEPREVNKTNNKFSSSCNIKDKVKRKYGELDRLDVTVIRISDSPTVDTKNICHNAYCTLGCICDSLRYSYILKRHCGRIECMFECKCDYSKYKLTDSLDNDCSDIIPDLVNLDKKLGQRLAKEEQKFRQTVIVTDEKSILLKSQKRNWKTSKKYADFYSNMRLKAECETKQILTIVCRNLKFKNVEPWCMVHKLYKCFCQGKFTESNFTVEDDLIVTDNNITETNIKVVENIDLTTDEIIEGINLKTRKDDTSGKKHSCHDNNESDVCARTVPYEGRKYDKEYYHSTNKKISEMERNDQTLRKKLENIMNQEKCFENNLLHNVNTPDITSPPASLNELLINVMDQIPLEYNDVKKLSVKKLVAWLESNYKQYKEDNIEGLIKHSLHPPRPGTMALYPWDFILSRYRERKNHFLLSEKPPFRIFMAVNNKNSFFDNCLNINDIELSDLDKYPVTVKNLLTNATDLKDNFCILCGLSSCWELVGSVIKVSNNKSNPKQETDMDKNITHDEKSQSGSSSDLEFMPVFTENCSDELNSSVENVVNEEHNINTEQSKWFVMTVENDFTEIRFYKRGFFVKYESIIKAINVAKTSGKTVKLSAQNSRSLQNSSSFGIYAIPSDKDNYVFIGPYEKHEALGVETIKNVGNNRKTRSTRGTWITTNKIDNLKVIDNPLLYMPSNSTQNTNMLSLETNVNLNVETNNRQEVSDNISSSSASHETANKRIVTKVVKPIRIQKNKFYQLAPNGTLKQVSSTNKNNLKYSQALFLKKPLLFNKNTNSSNASALCQDFSQCSEQTEKQNVSQSQKPIAEIAPQIKECNDGDLTSGLRKRKLEGGMFILKPEEINKRSFEKQSLREKPLSNSEDTIGTDIDNFLQLSAVCQRPKNDCYIISDDEEDNTSNSHTKHDTCKNVWIVCRNIDDLGWIPGKRNLENDLSFEFPGFKYSEFYKEEEALNKITQVLCRKIYVPRHINLEWQVLESLPDSMIKTKLKAKDLCTDYVLTKKGLQHKSELLKKIKLLSNVNCLESSTTCKQSNNKDDTTEKKNIINDLEETSKTLEEESKFLWDKTMSKKGDILKSFSKASEDLRKELTKQLSNIKYNAEKSE